MKMTGAETKALLAGGADGLWRSDKDRSASLLPPNQEEGSLNYELETENLPIVS